MPETDYYIRKLEASDTVQNFKVGSEAFLPLKAFLQKQAKQFQQSSISVVHHHKRYMLQTQLFSS
jgi:hypothetical protein